MNILHRENHSDSSLQRFLYRKAEKVPKILQYISKFYIKIFGCYVGNGTLITCSWRNNNTTVDNLLLRKKILQKKLTILKIIWKCQILLVIIKSPFFGTFFVVLLVIKNLFNIVIKKSLK